MKKINFIYLFPFSILFLFSSCSINKMAVKEISSIIDKGMPAIFRETDINYAKQSLPSNLKLMEIMMETEKTDLLLLNASIGFCGYAFAFLEDESPQSATLFYLKGLKYSEELLKRKKIFEGDKIIYEKINKKNAPYLFWNTFCKSGIVNINRDKPKYLIMLDEIKEQAEMLIKIYPDYFYNSAYNLLASFYASRPEVLGGNLKKAFEYFEKAISPPGNEFLLNYLMYARTYAIMTQNKELFEKNIDIILNHELKENDEKNFFNILAIEKAKKLKEKKDEFF